MAHSNVFEHGPVHPDSDIHADDATELRIPSNDIVSIEQVQAETQLASAPLPPPDGGLRAWSQVSAGHLINSLTW